MKSKILKLSIIFSLFFVCNLTYGQDKTADYKSIEITGFDKSGEPEMKFYNDGRIELVFKKC
uniref:hypothetical protein n=1 Tax=Flavobacterium sp. TaxID=239 RepID=UPI00374D8F5B